MKLHRRLLVTAVIFGVSTFELIIFLIGKKHKDIDVDKFYSKIEEKTPEKIVNYLHELIDEAEKELL